MRVILRVTGTTDVVDGIDMAVVDGIDMAVVDIGQWEAQRYLDLIKLHKRVSAKRDNLYALSFWERRCSFGEFADTQSGPEEEAAERVSSDLEDEAFSLVQALTEWKDARTELDQLQVLDDGIYWTCVPKHCDVALETSRVPDSLLQDIAKGRLT